MARATLALLGGLAGLLMTAPAAAEVPLVCLAELFAKEIEAAAAGRGIELCEPEDRTGRGGTPAADFADLLLTRLESRVSLRAEGPRLTVTPILSEDSHRLAVSARVVQLPEGRLVDLLSVSVDKDPTRLSPSPVPPPLTRGSFEVLSVHRTSPLPEPPLDLAFVDEAHLIAVFPDRVALLRRQADDVELISQLSLPGPLLAVRAPGAIVVSDAEPDSFWVLSSQASAAMRVRVGDGVLSQTGSAVGLPLPDSAEGIRYRVGTDQLEGLPPRFGPPPHLALDGDYAVSGAGLLVDAAPRPPSEAAPVHSGPAMKMVWPGVLAAASANPPGRRDTIQFVTVGMQPPRVIQTIPVEGAVRALCARERSANGRALLAVAVELERRHHIVFMTVARIQADLPPPGAPRP